MPDYNITSEDILYRRVPRTNPSFWKIVDGKLIPSSFAFKTKPGEDGLSVDISALTTPEITAMDGEQFGIAGISASIPLNLGHQCKHDPKPNNNAHALIVGDTNPIAKKLSIAAIQIR